MTFTGNCATLGDMQTVEDKNGSLLADEFHAARLPVEIVQAKTVYPHEYPRLTVEITVPDVANWDLRYQILDVVGRFEDDRNVDVICLFRQAVAAA